MLFRPGSQFAPLESAHWSHPVAMETAEIIHTLSFPQLNHLGDVDLPSDTMFHSNDDF